MPYTAEELQALKKASERKAEQFTANPEEGSAAGYTPQHKFVQSREVELNVDRTPVKVGSDKAAWLRDIAAKDLRGMNYKIREGIAGFASIRIYGP